MLELERMKRLNEKALLIQRVLRGFKYRSGGGDPHRLGPAHLL